MVSISGRQNDWFETRESPKFSEAGPADYFNYSYPTNYFWYQLLGPVGKFVLQHLFWKVKVEGLENVPLNSNFILMPNHLSHADSFFALTNLWPRKAVNAISDEKLFKNKYFKIVAKMFNVFPVRKNTKNLNIVRYAAKRINNGDSLLWYPEGQRHKSPWENQTYSGKLGSGMLAHAVNAPIIPCYVSGTEFVMPVSEGVNVGKSPRSIDVLVRYGKPIPLDDLRSLPASPETSQKIVDRIMEHIEELRPGGPYRDQAHKIASKFHSDRSQKYIARHVGFY